MSFGQTLLAGLRYVYGVHAVSKAGLEERSTHVVTCVEIDGQGNLLPQPLARPEDVAARVQIDGSVLVGFSYDAPLGFATSDGFDVLGDHGTGQLDLENPIAAVDILADDQRDFEVRIAQPVTPLLLAVRARRGDQTGPLSKFAFVPLPSSPPQARIL